MSGPCAGSIQIGRLVSTRAPLGVYLSSVRVTVSVFTGGVDVLHDENDLREIQRHRQIVVHTGIVVVVRIATAAFA